MAKGKRRKVKKKEYSKILCSLVVLYGVANGILYNIQVFMGLDPDPALAVQSVITIVGGFLSYLLYQLGLKSSRNKYGIDEEGQPFRTKEIDYDEEENM